MNPDKKACINYFQDFLEHFGPVFGIPLDGNTSGNDTIFGFVLLFVLAVLVIGFLRWLLRKE